MQHRMSTTPPLADRIALVTGVDVEINATTREPIAGDLTHWRGQ
jgi:hypothetical protein